MLELSYIAAEMADDFEEAVRLGTRAGTRWVALRSRVWGKNLEALSGEDVERMQGILARYGARVSAVYSGVGKCNIEDDDEVEHNVASLPRMIELAHVFGTRLIRVFPFQRSGVVEYEPSHLQEYLVRIVERYMPLVQMAQAEDVVLCFEAVGSTLARTAEDLSRVIEALGRPKGAGIVWEIDVAWRAGEPPSRGFPFARGITKDVHVKPSPGIALAGEGETYEQAFRSLLGSGYSGPITIEHWQSTPAALEALGRIKPILARLQ
jgi:sugar phosphate isomerase/epimerase